MAPGAGVSPTPPPGGSFGWGSSRRKPDDVARRRAASRAAGKSGDAGESKVTSSKTTSSSTTSSSASFTSSSSSASGASSSRVTSGTSAAPTNPPVFARGPAPGGGRVGLEDWPTMPSTPAARLPVPADGALSELTRYRPSPEVVRAGSWPYNYVSNPTPSSASSSLTPRLGSTAKTAPVNTLARFRG